MIKVLLLVLLFIETIIIHETIHFCVACYFGFKPKFSIKKIKWFYNPCITFDMKDNVIDWGNLKYICMAPFIPTILLMVLWYYIYNIEIFNPILWGVTMALYMCIHDIKLSIRSIKLWNKTPRSC